MTYQRPAMNQRSPTLMPEPKQHPHAVRHHLIDDKEKPGGDEHHDEHHAGRHHGLLAARPGDARGLLADLLGKFGDVQFGHTDYSNSQSLFRRMMAGVEGLEPPTPGFGDRCSTS